MEAWRYLRDVLIVVAVLLLLSGLAVGWVFFCVFAWLSATLMYLFWDSNLARSCVKLWRRWA